MNWDDLRHFAALVSAGSLSAAARALGVEHATVARRVAALETTLGVALVDRRGRRWTPTAEGERVAAIAERMEKEAIAVRRAADGARAEVAGTVTVSAPPALAADCLTAPLAALRARHPDLDIQIIGEARTASLERGEADIAIRLTRPDRGDLIILKLGEMPFRLYASFAYLAATPEPDWCFIGYDVPGGRAPQQVALEDHAAGRRFAFRARSVEIQRAAAAAGAGIAALPDFMAQSNATLIRVPPGAPLLVRDIWLAVHADLRRSAPIRAVIQTLQRAFGQHR
jgi:DNA-binding transcriptional LysR family regulator